MKIKLRYYEDADESPRLAEREFEWEENMRNSIIVANPQNPTYTLALYICDEIKGGESGGLRTWVVCEEGEDLASFEEIFKYGFVKVQGV